MATFKTLSYSDLLGVSEHLTHKQVQFLIDYCKDFELGRAATAANLTVTDAQAILDDEHGQAVVNRILSQRVDASHIDAEWVKEQLVNNHYLALQKDNIPASNVALNQIAKLAEVDAFAATKIEMSTDEQVRERLQKARQRLVASSKASPPDFLH